MESDRKEESEEEKKKNDKTVQKKKVMLRTGRAETNSAFPSPALVSLSLHVSLPVSCLSTESFALHLLAEHAGHGDIEREMERWRQRGRESDGENIDSLVLVCSAPEPQGYGTRDGERARREGESLCWRWRGVERQGWSEVRVRGREGVRRGS